MKPVLKSVVSRLDKISPGRIRIDIKSDFGIFTNPIHLDQLITNLVTNALKFSPSSKSVDLVVDGHCLIVKDYGAGIASEVRERIGEPFNVGSNHEEGKTGNGLGLAWVSTVVKIYQWEFEIKSDPSGTEARIQFPNELET